MKIKADYANAPQWKETTIKSSLPKELKCLDEIAHNMWWAWNYEGRDLFKSLDADLYEKCNANPVLLLERLSYDRKEAIVKDKETMAKVKNVYKMFREYMDVKPNSKRPSVAYFCMEFGINQVVKIYSGGLGIYGIGSHASYPHIHELLLHADAVLQAYTLVESLEREVFDKRYTVYLYVVNLCTEFNGFCFLASYDRTYIMTVDADDAVTDFPSFKHFLLLYKNLSDDRKTLPVIPGIPE